MGYWPHQEPDLWPGGSEAEQGFVTVYKKKWKAKGQLSWSKDVEKASTRVPSASLSGTPESQAVLTTPSKPGTEDDFDPFPLSRGFLQTISHLSGGSSVLPQSISTTGFQP